MWNYTFVRHPCSWSWKCLVVYYSYSCTHPLCEDADIVAVRPLKAYVEGYACYDPGTRNLKKPLKLLEFKDTLLYIIAEYVHVGGTRVQISWQRSRLTHMWTSTFIWRKIVTQTRCHLLATLQAVPRAIANRSNHMVGYASLHEQASMQGEIS